MSNLINPQIELVVYAKDTFTIKDLYMDFEISKDLEEESNEASITIYNLNEGTRKRLTDRASQESPIEIMLTKAGSTQLVMAFRGEIETARHRSTQPGYETTLQCTSQQLNHRSLPITQKTFSKGTAIDEIIDSLIESINLPRGVIDDIPTSGILLSESFSGPAYPLLQRYAFDIGMYAYILDGKVNVTSIYEPPNPTVIPIYATQMLAEPKPTTRTDDHLVEMKTIVESVNIDPFRKKRKQKKKKRVKKVVRWWAKGQTVVAETEDPSEDYLQYETVDKLIEGMEFELTLQPDIQPDNIINPQTAELKNRMFRVREVEHFGNNEDFNDWTTQLQTDAYYDEDGNLLAGL